MTIDEDAFLADLLPRLATGDDLVVPPGDDCAALAWNDELALLVAVDQVAADVHYHGPKSETPTEAWRVGRKLLARNLSDIAAMGGTPRWTLLAVGAAPDCPREWLDEFAAGIVALAEEYGVLLVGGDLAGAGSDVASLTILGDVPRKEIVRRKGAAPGHVVYVTGSFGASLVTEHHLDFIPRVREGRWLAAEGFATAMIDVSDGLLKDLGRLVDASAVTAILEVGDLPRRKAQGGACDVAAALLDGEDYELIFTVDARRGAALEAAWPFAVPLTRIGKCVECDAAAVTDRKGRPLHELYPQTFRHFAAE